MDAEFWHLRWENNEIGFHGSDTNPLLSAHFNQLSLSPGQRVLVPLCGKTLDIAWLLSQGMNVVGVELSELAVKQLFEELETDPVIKTMGNIKHYHAPHIDILVGDFFNVTRDLLGSVDAIYDRAALVALPDSLRARYSQHLRDITENAAQLLITFEYNQEQLEGPPFSIPLIEVHRLYAHHYAASLLVSVEVEGGLKGCEATEHVWLLKPGTADNAGEDNG